MIYKSVKIPNPHNIFGDGGEIYRSLRNGLKAQGFKSYKYYEGTEITAITEYWWSEAGPFFKRVPAGRFFVYDCTYPVYRTNKVTVVQKSRSADEFYDDTIDEKLGGLEEKLGV